jgi:hypothetical protein
MLRHQQANAVVAARQRIVEGAVGMVDMALTSLAELSIVDLDEERNAQIEYLLRKALQAEGRLPSTPGECAAWAAHAASRSSRRREPGEDGLDVARVGCVAPLLRQCETEPPGLNATHHHAAGHRGQRGPITRQVSEQMPRLARLGDAAVAAAIVELIHVTGGQAGRTTICHHLLSGHYAWRSRVDLV